MNKLLYSGLVGAVCASFPATVRAQASGAPAVAQDQIEDIVVTARRSEEALQTTPVAVTALSSAGLERKQITDVAAVQRAAPNLTITTGTPAASGFAIISMRGQSNLNAGNASDPAVGIYLDGAYIARPAGALFDLVDMQRVEVLRGPQGTLFGRNTIGGALNLTTNQPDGDLLLSGRLTAGNYGNLEATGVLNLPLSGDELAVRMAYKYRERDGFGRDGLTGKPLNDKRDDQYARFQARWAPASSGFEAVFGFDWNKSNDSGQLAGATGINPLVVGPAASQALEAAYLHRKSDWYVGYNTSDTGTNALYQPSNHVDGWGTSLRLSAELGAITAKSITAYRKLDSSGYIDLDGTPVSFLEPYNRYRSKGVSQEFQLSGTMGEFSWIGGVFYFREKNTEQSDARIFAGPWFRNYADIVNESYAGYVQGYYQISDRLRATAGFRYTWDKRHVVIQNLAAIYPAPVCGVDVANRDDGVNCAQTLDKKFDYPAFTVGLDYQVTDNIFVYAKSSGAYMAGGWNLRQGSAPAFKPEQTKDVEIGVKAEWFDRRLRTNIAIFHSWQSDVQRNISAVVSTPNGDVSTQFIRNAGDAHVTGFEFEGTMVPWRGMEVTGQFGYTDAHYNKGTFLDVQTIGGIAGCNGGAAIGTYNCTVDRSGERLPQVPKITYGIGATQTIPTNFGSIAVHADYAFIGNQTFAPNTPAAAQPAAVKAAYARANELSRIAGYGLLNGRLTLSVDDEHFELSLWGRNMLGKKYYTRSFSDLYTSLGSAVSFIGEPRTYGLTASFKLGD
ncbi:TonB-dependent receptor [Sphingobium aromaticiconvertens]|uniref:TonB-dependent receptor n=1 Tax=Sphingobium aromaticiconvertens TaxID=365341 RepID=UPI003016D1D5